MSDEIDRLYAENSHLRAALFRISTPEAFYVATSDINPEAYARMIYAEYVLVGYTLKAATDKTEFETRERYPLRKFERHGEVPE